MNERNQSPPTWKVYTMREAAREFVRELWQHAAQKDPNLEKWARAYLLELNQAAEISATRSQEPGPAGNGEPPGGTAPVAAVVLPFPTPGPSQVPPAAARRYQDPGPGGGAGQLPGDLQDSRSARKVAGG